MTLKLIIGVNFDTKYQILILDSEFMLVMWNRSWTCNYVCELHPKIMEYYVKYNNDYYVIKSNQFTNKTLSNRSDQIRTSLFLLTQQCASLRCGRPTMLLYHIML